MVLGLLVLPVGALFVGFLDNTEHASLTEAFAECFLSASHPSPPPICIIP